VLHLPLGLGMIPLVLLLIPLAFSTSQSLPTYPRRFAPSRSATVLAPPAIVIISQPTVFAHPTCVVRHRCSLALDIKSVRRACGMLRYVAGDWLWLCEGGLCVYIVVGCVAGAYVCMKMRSEYLRWLLYILHVV
jgi:hypothetical protein